MDIEKTAADEKLRIVVLGYMVRGPIGGLAWHHMQYVLGLAAMGHDVCFAEDSDDYPSCYDPQRHVTDTNPAYGLKFVTKIFEKIGLKGRWAYHDAHRGEWLGPMHKEIQSFIKSADVLINVSGVNPMRSWFTGIPKRILIDTDPVFTQISHLTKKESRERAEAHTHFFTFGELFGAEGCSIPDDGFPWQATRQPVVLNAWPFEVCPARGRWTTVMQWDSYAKQEYSGQAYGMKAESFSKFLKLPLKTGNEFELALGTPSAPRDLLRDNGWVIEDPLKVTKDPWTYQEYIQKSKGEFTVSKHGYVISNSGWFSERSAAYLASGRPVITQDTGFSRLIGCGRGLFAVNDLDGAVAAVQEIDEDYEKHCKWARETAEQHFAADKVLREIL